MTIKFEMTAGGLALLTLGCCVTTLFTWAAGYVEGKEDAELEATTKELEARAKELADEYLNLKKMI